MSVRKDGRTIYRLEYLNADGQGVLFYLALSPTEAAKAKALFVKEYGARGTILVPSGEGRAELVGLAAVIAHWAFES